MKLAYVETDGRRFVAVRKGANFVDLSRSPLRWNKGLTDLLALGPDGLAAARSAVASADGSSLVDPAAVTYLRLNEPHCVTCVGSNYAAHIRERAKPFPKEPSCFLKGLPAFVAHRQPLERPGNSEQFDYEAELVIVVGRAGRHVPIERALDFVAGYTLMNDGSVRDFQERYSNITLGKNFPASSALGPEMVTADDVPPGAHGLRISTRINGSTAQDSNTADLVFDVPMLVSLVSHTVGLRPGDLIATGTPSGVAAGMTPPKWLKAGDEIEMSIEGVCTLSNIVVDALVAPAGHGYDRAAYAPKVLR
ncbi:fumarylacetoacetate hydrolase family protein [Ramlibacter sp. WS9]|uniref:fumarylacetoacetate hydrolase family protein n=1 Tax=Ramlibacter sp. WS9 TaxID=1882741 RepID=UPI001143B234|nr:fumarylacetoacetate hydrolase family protein [Ramlibacter sp. WS9]ROZ78126.1 FAA hydrolase family protein [Ramlibacter sp. WS9]HSV36717.1 fumarylacetoacetate hydrolase family protein [Ramlibacter sp.]